MRVLQIVHGFPPSGTGGSELYAERLSRGLALAGHDVAVFTRQADASRRELETRDESRDGIRVRWVNNTFRHTRRFQDTYENAGITALADAFVREVHPDVAHVHHITCLSTTILDMLAARGVPALLHLHDYWLLCHRGQLLDTAMARCDGPGLDGCDHCIGVEAATPGVIYRTRGALSGLRERVPVSWRGKLERHARAAITRTDSAAGSREASRRRLEHMRARFAHAVMAVAPSVHVRDRFVRAGFPADRIVVSEYGVGVTRVQMPPHDGPLRVGFLGALMASKAPHLLREAIDLVPPGVVEATFFGAPASYHGDTSYSDAIVGRLGHPSISIQGPVPHDQVGAALASIDVLVFPSIWEETSGIGAREALSVGVPVLASRIGGVPEFVRDGVNGLLFTPGDAVDLARQLRRLVEDPSLLPRLRAGIAPVRSFDDDLTATVARYESIRRGAITGQPSRRIAAVVLNFETPDETATAVAWLRMSDPPLDEIVVVDNGDGQALQAVMDASDERVHIVATGANLGFARGSNAGIQAALDRGADAVFLVNSDVAVPPDAVRSLSSALDARTGIVGPVVRNRARPDEVHSAGIDFNARSGRMRVRTTTAPAGVAPAAVSGCAMLVDRRVFERIGLLPVEYFFGFEDIAFCQRARAAGIVTAVVPRAVVYHEGGATMGASTDRLYYGARDHLRLAGETPATSRAHAARRRLAIVGYSLAHAVTARGGSLLSRLWAVARGVLDGLRGREGPRR